MPVVFGKNVSSKGFGWVGQQVLKTMSLKGFRNRNTCQFQNSQCYIDNADHAVSYHLGFFHLLGQSDDKRRFHTTVINSGFTTGKWPAIVSHNDDNGIVPNALTFQYLFNFTDGMVKTLYFIVVFGKVTACFLSISQIWWRADLIWIVSITEFIWSEASGNILSNELKMRHGKSDHCEIVPCGCTSRRIPFQTCLRFGNLNLVKPVDETERCLSLPPSSGIVTRLCLSRAHIDHYLTADDGL